LAFRYVVIIADRVSLIFFSDSIFWKDNYPTVSYAKSKKLWESAKSQGLRFLIQNDIVGQETEQLNHIHEEYIVSASFFMLTYSLSVLT
jgi:hypothetical protein